VRSSAGPAALIPSAEYLSRLGHLFGSLMPREGVLKASASYSSI
jgi:hypothetical protein